MNAGVRNFIGPDANRPDQAPFPEPNPSPNPDPNPTPFPPEPFPPPIPPQPVRPPIPQWLEKARGCVDESISCRTACTTD